jgi:large subunit ribosomal protein L13
VNTRSYKTLSVNKDAVMRKWVLLDAENQIVGRFASQVARILTGKHKPYYTPHVECGDNVIIINAARVKLTGKKWKEKEYVWYTGYPGGQRYATPQEMMSKNPVFVLEHAIHRMLPKNRLGNKMKRHLYIYAGSEHPHQAQQPIKIEIPL